MVREGLRPPPRDQREQPRGEVSGGVDGVPGVEPEAEWDEGGNDRSLLDLSERAPESKTKLKD